MGQNYSRPLGGPLSKRLTGGGMAINNAEIMANRRILGNAKVSDATAKRAFDIQQGGKVQGSFKKGGRVKKTGLYKLHKGERVLNKKQTKKYARIKKSKGTLLK